MFLALFLHSQASWIFVHALLGWKSGSISSHVQAMTVQNCRPQYHVTHERDGKLEVGSPERDRVGTSAPISLSVADGANGLIKFVTNRDKNLQLCSISTPRSGVVRRSFPPIKKSIKKLGRVSSDLPTILLSSDDEKIPGRVAICVPREFCNSRVSIVVNFWSRMPKEGSRFAWRFRETVVCDSSDRISGANCECLFQQRPTVQ